MTNSRKVKGDVGSGWFMAEEWMENALKMFQIDTNKTFSFFFLSRTDNESIIKRFSLAVKGQFI